MRSALSWLVVMLTAVLVARLPALAPLKPFWPAVSAIAVILATRQAAAGLGAGVAAGCLILAAGQPLDALRLALGTHVFPQLGGDWHIGALAFTLLLGAFAGLLESSGGFESLLRRMLQGAVAPQRRVLGAAYATGLACFFDGLANSMLVGRIVRPVADRTGISREKLAWVVDSTSSPVACVAFISTWIATQLTLIRDGLPELDAYDLFRRSIPANGYCLLTLLLVPLAIGLRWEPRSMRRYQPVTPQDDDAPRHASAVWRIAVPLACLAFGIALSFQLWSGNPLDLLSAEAWREAASGEAGPVALVAGALAGLCAAWLCFPKTAPKPAGKAALDGAAGLLPALVVLVLAWSLGSVFEALGAAAAVKRVLGEHVATAWLPLAVFLTAGATSFATGSSWGTMALIMPLALGVLRDGSDPAILASAAPPVIAAVFGGAVFGDHASPFSDTTIVSALAAGCRPLDHVLSQLPYALTAALAAIGAYTLIGLGLHPALATLLAAVALASCVAILARRRAGRT
jgi:Na+/H+ antiporter NhaC